jgi:type II secretory pathway component PulK
MCIPAAAVAAVATVATTAASVVGQIQSAKAQNNAIKQQAEVVFEENRKKASSELFDQMRATRREQSRIRAASGEAGLSLQSGSIEALLNDSAMQGSLQGSRTLANLESRQTDTAAEAN